VTALRIPLERVTAPVVGVYDINRDGKPEELPARALWLCPEAAAWFNAGHGAGLVVSDMFRGPDSSKAAVASGRGAAAPGRSSHNYGRAIDIDVRETMERLGLGVKAELDAWMNASGWWCWREDHARPSWNPRPNEAWHYFWAPNVVTYHGGSAARWWQRTMDAEYPVGIPDARDRQTWLRSLGYYSGVIDGAWGPLSRTALAAFGRAWGLTTDRTLAYTAWHWARRHSIPNGDPVLLEMTER
jgi:hypothetical protein